MKGTSGLCGSSFETRKSAHLRMTLCPGSAAPVISAWTRVLATSFARVVPVVPSTRGSRECRVDQPHPRPHVQMKKAHELKSPQVRRNDPAFPARWLYDLFRALSGDRAFLSPSPLRSVSFLRASRQRRGVKTTRLCRPRDKRIRLVRSPAAIASRAQRP